MALKVWIGGAPENAQVDTVVISDDIQPGMIIKATIGSSSITYTVPAGDSLSQVVASFVSLWNSSEIPEFAEIEAEAGLNGSFTLTMLASSAGKSFIVSFIIGSGTNEKQTITIGNNPTGGTFTLAYEGQVTAGIAPDASAATVKSALEALSTIEVGEIDVTGADGGPWTVEFIGDLAGVNVSEIGANPDNLSVTAETQVVDLGGATGGTFTIQYGESGTPSANLAFNISAANLKTAIESLTGIAVDDVAVAGSDGGPFTLTFQGAFTGMDAESFLVNGANLTGGLMDAVTIAEQTAGGGGGNEVWTLFENDGSEEGSVRIVGNTNVSGGTFDLSIEITLSGEGSADTLLAMTDIPYDVTISEFQALIDANIAANDLAFYGKLIRVQRTTATAGQMLTSGSSWELFIRNYIGADTLTSLLDSTNLTGGTYGYHELTGFVNRQDDWYDDTWVLSINGDETETLASNATASEVEAALEALPAIGEGNVNVEFLWTNWYYGMRLTFQGDLANQATGFAVNLASGPGYSSDKNWLGAAGTSEVQRISISGSPGAGEFSIIKGTGFSQAIAYNQTAEELEDILEAVSTIGPGKVSCSGGPFPDSFIDVTFTGSLGGTNVDLMVKNQGAVETTAEGGEAATVEVTTVQSTIQHETTVASSGPNDWNTPANWDTGTVPVDGDDVLIPDGDNILYGLDQSDLTFTLRVTARETELGLPRRNENADLEYRDRFLKASFTSIVIDSNSQLINVDFQDSNPTIEVLNSGSGREVDYAVQLIGENTANTATLLVLAGNVGVAKGPKEAAYFKTITQRGGQIWIGQDVGLEDIERTGGQIHADRSTIDGTLTL